MKYKVILCFLILMLIIDGMLIIANIQSRQSFEDYHDRVLSESNSSVDRETIETGDNVLETDTSYDNETNHIEEETIDMLDTDETISDVELHPNNTRINIDSFNERAHLVFSDDFDGGFKYDWLTVQCSDRIGYAMLAGDDYYTDYLQIQGNSDKATLIRQYASYDDIKHLKISTYVRVDRKGIDTNNRIIISNGDVTYEFCLDQFEEYKWMHVEIYIDFVDELTLFRAADATDIDEVYTEYVVDNISGSGNIQNSIDTWGGTNIVFVTGIDESLGGIFKLASYYVSGY